MTDDAGIALVAALDQNYAIGSQGCMCHVLALFDWDRPSTYVSCTECQLGRVGATFALAMLWLLAGVGAFVVALRRPPPRHSPSLP